METFFSESVLNRCYKQNDRLSKQNKKVFHIFGQSITLGRSISSNGRNLIHGLEQVRLLNPLIQVDLSNFSLQLAMAPESDEKHENGSSLPKESNKEQALDVIDDRIKTARHPRWTRQETIVLIQGKNVVENRIQEIHGLIAVGSEQNEPKWDSVASYCKQHGVNRGPVQCRKRWSNLLGDFKKIKTWESQVKEEVKSFWVMRNDLRKEMKLPSFFDREVYDALDGVFATPAIPLTLITTTTDTKRGEVYEIMSMAEEEEAEADGLFSDFEATGQEENGNNPEKKTTALESPTKTVATPFHFSDTVKEKHPGATCMGSTSQKRWKRRRLSLHVSKDTDKGDRLIKVLERNSNMLSAQLEAQNINCQLDREQKKEHSDNLIAAVSKLTDALLRIANKL